MRQAQGLGTRALPRKEHSGQRRPKVVDRSRSGSLGRPGSTPPHRRLYLCPADHGARPGKAASLTAWGWRSRARLGPVGVALGDQRAVQTSCCFELFLGVASLTARLVLRAEELLDLMMDEGLRKDNPARQTCRPRRRPALKYRLAEGEVVAGLEAAHGTRERRVMFLGLCAGLRNAEPRGQQGRHFARPGLIWVSGDIGKGGRERWVPVIAESGAGHG